jgi:Fe-S-cluster containining protein
MCGNCCSGPSGFVLVNDTERTALAARLKISEAEFTARYTTMLPIGRSLIEKPAPDQTHSAMDCIFLDREKIPGKAVCGVYEDRPRQCRTWPFWNSTLQNPESWARAGRTCPGINKGPLHELVQIRISRNVVDI